MKKAYYNQYETLREKLEDVVGEIHQLASELRDQWEERSEKWQESEKGEEWADFIDQLESIEPDIAEWPE